MTYRDGRFWQPDVTVATIVERDGRFLLVDETSQGRLVLNQPAGHLEPNESLLQAAVRETLEESAWTVELTGFLGAFQWRAPDAAEGGSGRHYLRFAFIANALQHEPERPLDAGIERTVWLTREEIEASQDRLRSPLVLHVLQQYWDGNHFPLSLVGQLDQ